MQPPSVYFVGQPHEVAHHAAPFQESLDVKIADPAEVLRQANQGDLAIFYSEHFDRFRECCQQLKQRNVATLYMIDGILEWRNAWENNPDEVACPYTMRPVLAHKVACIGNSQARVLQAWGNGGKTEVVGIPRMDDFDQRHSRRNSSDQEFRILVMTAKTPGFTPEQVQTVRQSLIDLKQWQVENPTVVARKRAGDDLKTYPTQFVWRLTGDLASEIGVENELSDLTGQELADVLCHVDAVISTPSTAMLEAMRLGLPTAVLDYHNCPHYVTAGWDICAREHISPSLKQMLERSPTRMLFQENELADSLLVQGKASARLVELVNQMLNISREQICAGQTSKPDSLSFPAQILAPSLPLAGEFCHRSMYESAVEFSIEDKAVLQVELSHARREISYLHREMAQLQSELDQAHQIFEQIEKHPIAGPIVRIRQKMLDLMAAIRKHKIELETTRPVTSANPANSQTETPLN